MFNQLLYLEMLPPLNLRIKLEKVDPIPYVFLKILLDV